MNTKLHHLCALLSFFASWGIGSAATIIWINPAGGNWSQATNWSPAQVPGAADTAVIDIDGNYTVALDTSATVTNLVLGAPGNLHTQTFSMNGQTLTLDGQGMVSPSGRFNFNGGNLAGACVCAGTLNWSGGQMNAGSTVTIATNGVLNLNGSGTLTFLGALTNAGTVNWTGACNLQIYNGAYGYTGGINNLAGAVFNAQCDQTIVCGCYGPEYFNNAGIFRKSGSVNTTTIGVPFNNSGTVEVQSGTISLSGGGTGSAQFIADAGATLAIANNYTASGAAVFGGAGTNLWTSGTISINGSVTTSNSLLAGAILAGNSSFSGALNWTSGNLGTGATLTIATNGVLNLSGSSTLEFLGALTNAGTVNWTGACTLAVYNGAYGYTGGMNNLSGAVFNAQCDQTIVCGCYGPEYFNNAGTFRKSASVNTTTIGVSFNNSGTVEVQSGAISLNGGGTGSAQFIADAGATLAIANNYTASGAAVFGGAGTNLWTAGTISINGSVTTSNSLLAGAILAGNSSFSGALNWTSGNLDTGATLTIATNGVLNLSGSSTLEFLGALTNAGTVNWTGACTLAVYNGAYGYTGGMNNLSGAVFNAQCDQTIVCGCYGPEYFNNAGIFRKSGSVNTTTIGVPFNNSGTVEVQSGTVSLTGGGSGSAQFIAEAGATLAIANNYAASGDGVFGGAGTNLWTSGTITINGSVTTSNSILAGATLAGNSSFSSRLDWTSGSLGTGATLTIATNGVLNLSGSSTLAFLGVLTNAGTVNWTGGCNLALYNGNYGQTGGINNLAGAVFNVLSDQTVSAGYGQEYFHNAGIIRKSGAVNTTTINVTFDNTGTLDVQSGALLINGNGSGTLYSGSQLTGLGTLLFNSGTLTLDGAISSANLVFAGGTLAGAGVVSGVLTWTGGNIGTGATLTIATNGLLNLSGSSTLEFLGALTNAGTVNWTGTCNLALYNGNYGQTGGINNLPGAVFNVWNDQTVSRGYGPEYFDNAGMLRKWATTGATTIGVVFNNTGTMDIESGAISLTSSYDLSGGILNFGVTSVTNFGSLNLAGAASLAGSLSVHVNPGYVPAASNVFALVTYGSGTGTFASVNLPAELNWHTNYSSTAFTVTAGFPPSALGWLNLGYTTNGTYTIDPSGSGPFSINTLMTLAGGGWTELTAAVADSLLNTNIGTSRDYLYVQTGTSYYYRTPLCGLVWNWASGQDLDGTYYYSTGSGESSFQIIPSSEHTAYGVGGSSGAGATYKCLVSASSCLDANNAQVQLCQNLPGIFGAGCQCGVTVYIRENGALNAPAFPIVEGQPTNELQVMPGAAAQFSVSVSGAVPLYYQWLFNQTNLLAGATNATLTLNNVSNQLAGYYSVVVTNVYGSATSAVAVLQITPALTWTNPAAIGYATALGAAQLDASAPVPGNFVYNPPIGSVLNAGTNTLTAVFWPSNTVVFSSATGHVSLVVTPAPLTVTASNAARLYGQANPTFTGLLSGVVNGDNLTATFNSSATANSLPGTYPIVPALIDPNNRLGNYSVTTNNGTLTVNLTTLSITWPAPSSIYYGTALSGAQLNASANIPGSFTYTPGAGAVFNAGTNLLTAMFTPADTADFNKSTNHVNLVVLPAPLVVTANNVSRPYGQTNPVLTGVLVGVTNGDSITATYATTAAANSPAGNYPIIPTLVDTNNRLANYTVTTNNGTLTVSQLLPLITWVPPAGIVYPTALSATQLDATASVPGSPAYLPAAGTVLNAGTNVLTVVFTPLDSTNYSTATDTVSLVVSPTPLAVSANNATRAYGQANPAFTGTISGVVNGDNLTVTGSCSAVSYSPPGTYPIIPVVVDPNHRLGNYIVSATNGTLTVTPGPAPTLVALTPNRGLTNGGTSVTIIGSGFELGAGVSFGGQAASSPVVNSGTQITAVTPAGPLAAVNVTVNNPDGTAATLTNGFTYIGPPPIILTQPTNLLVAQGSNAIFSVAATNLTGYQWLFNGGALTDNGRISGSHGPVLTVPGAQPTDAGNYEVVVNNAWGSTNSAVATLSIIAPPVMVTPPQNQTVGIGGLAIFTVTVNGTAPFTYQWLLGGNPVPGATNSVFSIANVTTGNQGQQYSVKVSNLSGSVTSTAATLTVLNYCASAQPGQSIYPLGSPVPLTLQTFNCSSQVAVPNSSATVWISTGGTTRSLAATTGAGGAATVTFIPLPTESGTYYVAAALPGQSIPAAQGMFSIVGMSLSRSSVYAGLTPGSPVTNAISLNNLTGTALTGITASIVGSNADVQVTLNVPATLAGNATGALTFVLLASGNYVAQDQFTIQLTTDQGTTNAVAVTATITPLYPQLVATPASLGATMVAGGQTLVNFNVANHGGVTSGPVQVLLPSVPWLSTVTPLPLPPLASGQSNQVTLALTPTNNLPLGAYPGSMELTTSNADLSVPFQFDCVSALTGSLQVTVQDELSQYGAGTPNVSNATVTVTDFLTGAPVTNVVTDASGIVLFTNLTSAYYSVAVTAPDHGSFSTTLLVAANQTNDLTAFLALQLVDYTWVVTPTIIPDHYVFTLDTTFQTQVPWPVVTVTPGAIDLCTLQGITNQINLLITNWGLISAQQAYLYFGSNADWSIQPLVTNLGDLAPESSIVVPVTIVRLSTATDVPDTITAQLGFSVTTPTQFYSHIVPIYVFDANPLDCLPANPTPPPVAAVCPTCGGGGGGGGGGAGAPGGGGPGGGGGGAGGGGGGGPTIGAPSYVFQTPQGAIVQVKLQIEQSAVIARDAFKASLELVNGAGATISNLSASITVYDASNHVANNLFGLPPPTLSGLNAVDGTGVLANGATGSAAWTIVPATNAAPTTPTQFSVGGSFSYILNGEPVTVPLFPVPITVLPTPILNVDYFLQHDVYSDDPFTPQIEASIPFPLGIRVHNIGYGDAYDFTITSAQPQIIQNSNDLLIAFELIGSQVGTNQSLSPSFTLDLGNIGPMGSADGLWYLTSTLEGQFIAFSASYQHVDDFGNTNTTLINSLNIHEMNHVVELTAPTDDGLPDFLVNDTTNVDAPPGIVYSSDGTTYPVNSFMNSGVTIGTPSATVSNITVTVPAAAGWAYYEIVDPGNDNFPIASVTRSDGVKLLVGPNVWQTPERIHMLPPKLNNLIHIFDYNSTGSYTVTYGLPVLMPSVTTLNALNITPTNATLNTLVNPNGANTDVYFQWGLTTNYGTTTVTTTLTDGLNDPQAVATVIGGLRPYNTYHFRAVGINSAGTTLGSDLTLITPQLPPPMISPVSNQTSAVGQQLVISNHVQVATPPALYSLAASDPEGATISTNGVFRWTPACLQGSSTNLITIWVTDSSSPPLSNSMTFSVVVGQCVQLELGSTVMQVGTTSGIPVTLVSSLGLTNLNWMLSNPFGRFTNWGFASSNTTIGAVNSSQTFFNLNAAPGQTLQTPSLLGTIYFAALPGPSAVLSLVASNILGTALGGGVEGNIASDPARVIVIGTQPLLESKLGANSARLLILYDNPGTNYQLLVSTNLASTNWSSGATGMVTNLMEYIPVNPTAPVIFYRAQ